MFDAHTVTQRQNSAPAATLDSIAASGILNHMVKFYVAPLDRTFAALSDATRRALVMRLAQQPGLSVSELAAPFSMSLPAVMKHLDVLSDAGLVKRTKAGRTVACRLDAEPMRDAFEWLNRYEKFWSDRLSSLAAFLEEESWQSKQPRNQVSRSSGGSKRRRPKSSRPGPIRKK
ncbi:MAG: metalloregulator ArsR/SmtB family transcription factor [Xanthobacteraceae bacterium]